MPAVGEYYINFTESRKNICLSLYYNESNSFWFVSTIKNYQFKAKGFETNTNPLCLSNILKEFIVDNTKNYEMYV